jgi:hypothetical protein
VAVVVGIAGTAACGQNSILLPSAAVLEKIALLARARSRKQAYKELTTGVDRAVREKLDALIRVADDEARTPLAWLREWPEAPVQKNLAGIVQRLQSVRVFCKADRRHKDNLVNRAKMLDSSARTLLGMAKSLTRGSTQSHVPRSQ